MQIESSSRKSNIHFHEGRYSIRISHDLLDQEWDNFLSTVPGGHHVQSTLWAQVKALSKWKAIRIIVYEQERIIGGAQLLIRTIASLASIVYLTKGPIVLDNNLEVADVIINYACRVCREHRALIFVVQPANNGYEIASHLPECGFRPSLLKLAPVASLLLDLTSPIDQIMSNLKRQTRQNIRRGDEAGVIVREGREKDIDIFYEFYSITSRRHSFSPYSKQYFVHMQELFEPQGYFKLLFSEYLEKPISSLLIIPFGETVIAKTLGWSGDLPEFRPNDCLFWNAIKWSKMHGYHYFDFEGIDMESAKAILAGQSLPTNIQHSRDLFKLGYGGDVVIYPQAFVIIHNPLVNWIYKIINLTNSGHSTAWQILDWIRKI
jgi:lipid II:glycine glycyltransferase (peptidoglycan interpeptide bridge formation enzyme)